MRVNLSFGKLLKVYTQATLYTDDAAHHRQAVYNTLLTKKIEVGNINGCGKTQPQKLGNKSSRSAFQFRKESSGTSMRQI